jgi:hypothetical protein
MGITFEDVVRAMLLLGSLPNTWKTFKVTVCNSTPNDVVTWNLVKTKVLNEESKKFADKDGSSSHLEVLETHSLERSKSRGPGKGKRIRSKSKGKYAKFICHHYHEKDHIKWQCEQWKKDKIKRRSKFKNKPTVIVREAVLLQLRRSCFSCVENMMTYWSYY